MNKDKTIEKRAGFTQGPWVIELGKEHYLIEDEKGERIALIVNWTNATPEANARLIASAPDLYAQCRMLENLLENLQDEKGAHELCSDYEVESYKQVNEQLAQVRELLAKVDGGDEG